MKNILEISKGLGIPDDYVECYGKNKAKITEEYYDTIKDRPNAKLILMTSINPTPFGEGKTTQLELKVEQLEEEKQQLNHLRILIFTLQEIFMQLLVQIIYYVQ